MWRRLMRTSSRLDEPAAGTPSMSSPEPRECRDPPTCRRVWPNLTSANQVVRQTILRKAKTVQQRKRRLKPRAAKWLCLSDAYEPGRPRLFAKLITECSSRPQSGV